MPFSSRPSSSSSQGPFLRPSVTLLHHLFRQSLLLRPGSFLAMRCQSLRPLSSTVTSPKSQRNFSEKTGRAAYSATGPRDEVWCLPPPSIVLERGTFFTTHSPGRDGMEVFDLWETCHICAVANERGMQREKVSEVCTTVTSRSR